MKKIMMLAFCLSAFNSFADTAEIRQTTQLSLKGANAAKEIFLMLENSNAGTDVTPSNLVYFGKTLHARRFQIASNIIYSAELTIDPKEGSINKKNDQIILTGVLRSVAAELYQRMKLAGIQGTYIKCEVASESSSPYSCTINLSESL